MLGFGISGRKARQFEYNPVHFNSEKEARDKRRIELLGEDCDIPEGDSKKTYVPGEYIRKGMYNRRGIGVVKSKSNVAIIRSVAFVLLIIGLAIWLFS